MATDHDSVYMKVFYWLAILTVAEIGVTFLQTSKLTIGFLLVVLALAKACLVALFYMHLKFERPTLGIIALTPLIICAFLVVALLPDITAVHHKTENVPKQEAAVEHK
jgi:cytochrome c oxidase subunit 4